MGAWANLPRNLKMCIRTCQRWTVLSAKKCRKTLTIFILNRPKKCTLKWKTWIIWLPQCTRRIPIGWEIVRSRRNSMPRYWSTKWFLKKSENSEKRLKDRTWRQTLITAKRLQKLKFQIFRSWKINHSIILGFLTSFTAPSGKWMIFTTSKNKRKLGIF